MTPGWEKTVGLWLAGSLGSAFSPDAEKNVKLLRLAIFFKQIMIMIQCLLYFVGGFEVLIVHELEGDSLICNDWFPSARHFSVLYH